MERGGWSLPSCLCSWANGICDVLLLLCQSNVKLSAAREGKWKKNEKKNFADACCCCRKNRYQIKKLCLKTVHMPAPGDFKYLWFATFLIFKISRDAVCRTWCKLIPCLTWMWLVIHCSGGKGKAGPLKGSWGSHLAAEAWWGFSLCPRSKFWNLSSPTDSGTGSAPSSAPRQRSQHFGKCSHRRQGGAKERWCPLPPLQDTLSNLCHNDKGEPPFYSMA